MTFVNLLRYNYRLPMDETKMEFTRAVSYRSCQAIKLAVVDEQALKLL